MEVNIAIDAVRNIARKSIGAHDQVVESSAQITSILSGEHQHDDSDDDDDDDDVS